VKAGSVGSRFGILINRLFGLGSQETPIDVAPEVIPAFDVANQALEYRYPRGEVPFIAQENEPADIDDVSMVSLANPAASRVVVVVEQIQSIIGSTVLMAIKIDDSDAITANGMSRDGRRPGDAPVMGTTDSVAAAIASDTEGLRMLDAVMYHVGFVLPPGKQLECWGSGDNVAVNMVFIGYVRPCTPEEMSV